MSVSQKHSGKCWLPWLNVAEWKEVYKLIYEKDYQNWNKALDILHIWKFRTQLLPAGVEGTLIVLEALLTDSSKFPNFQLTSTYSTSLVRFLNLCAANGDKQGTFYKVAKKNKLPKWLIRIRHDIAHSHKLPSVSMLELSLKFCLDWLKDKYWEAHFDVMSDLVVENPNFEVLEDAAYVYVYLTSSLYNKPESAAVDDELADRINKLIKKPNLSNKKILHTVGNILKNVIIRNDIRKVSDLFSASLLSDGLMLDIVCEYNSFDRKKIPSNFVNAWSGLLNILHESRVLPNFVDHLFQYVCEENNNPERREVASLWVYEIFNGLLCIRKGGDGQDVLVFNKIGTSLLPENKEFVNEVLEKVTPYTLNFAREVLEYNNAPSEFIDDSVALISAATVPNLVQDLLSEKIFSVDDMHLTPSALENNNEDPLVPSRLRYRPIEDPSGFRNLWLGFLPNQPRNRNPTLDL